MIFILYLPILVFAMIGIVQSPHVATFVHNYIPTLDVFKRSTVDAAPEVPDIVAEATITLSPCIIDTVWTEESTPYAPVSTFSPETCLVVAGLVLVALGLIRLAWPKSSPKTRSDGECVQVVFDPAIPTAESIIKIVSSISFEGSLVRDGDDDGYETSCEWDDGEDNEGFDYAEEDSYAQSYDEGEYDEEDYENEQEESQVAELLQAFPPLSPTCPRMLDMVLWRPSRPTTPTTAAEEDKPKKTKTGLGGGRTVESRRSKAVPLGQGALNRIQDSRIPTVKHKALMTPRTPFPLMLKSGIYTLDSSPRTPIERAYSAWPPEAPSPSKLPKLYSSVSADSDEADIDSFSVEMVKQEPFPTSTPLLLSKGAAPKVEETPTPAQRPRGRPVITEGGFRMIRHFLGVARRSRVKDVPRSNRLSPLKGDSPNRTLVDDTELISAKGAPGKNVNDKGRVFVKVEAANPKAGARRARIMSTGLGLEEYRIVYDPCN